MLSKRVANIINFIRGEDPRVEQKVLYDTFVNQLELCKKYPMPYTFLMQYDAMVRPEYAKLLLENNDPNMEVGVWIELAREQIEKVGLEWQGNPEWKWDWHANPDLLVAYTQEERKLLIDELMNRFFEIFGYYPKSVGSWMLDSFSISYIAEKYNIDAFIICREQYGTDGYTLWGGYYNQAYFPSKKNMFMPAQSENEQIHTPVFRLLGIDHLHQYDCDHVMTLEPSWECGQDPNWVDWYFHSNFEEENISFSYTQVGQENSFTWATFGEALIMQMEKLYKGFSENRWEVLTLKETGKWFSSQYKMTPATAITSLEDWKKEDSQTVWYNSKNYRINFFVDKGNLTIRDIQLFDENYLDRYLVNKTSEHWAVYDALPIIDGFRWGNENKKSYLNFVESNTENCVNGKIADVQKLNDQDLRVVFESNVGKIVCSINEYGIKFNFDKDKADLLFNYDDLKDTEIVSVKQNEMVYRHNDTEYVFVLENAKVEKIDFGYKIVPNSNEFEMTFRRSNSND